MSLLTTLVPMMRLLGFVAAVSLSIVGGNFSHAVQAHEHSGSITSVADSHTHGNSDEDLVGNNDALHCGSNILSLSETFTLRLSKKRWLAPLSTSNISISAILEHELPPPRSTS